MITQPICGAQRKYDGAPCQGRPLRNDRCKLHGGKSSGPKTAEGRARIAEAQRDRWKRIADALAHARQSRACKG